MNAQNSSSSQGLTRRLLGVSMGDVIKLVAASAIVGVLLRVFNLNPATLWRDFFDAVSNWISSWPDLIANIVEGIGPAAAYVIYGAAIVIPVWLFFKVLSAVFGKR